MWAEIWRRAALQLPNATKGIFQAMMLFFLLASDILVRYRLRRIAAATARPRSRRRGAPHEHATMSSPSLITIVGASTPLLLAGLGELVTEKSGVLNLGVEGMMLIGAVAGFATMDLTGNPWLAVVVAAICRRGRLDDLRLPVAVAHGQPGGDGPGADHLRHRACLAGGAELHRPRHSDFHVGVPRCARRRSVLARDLRIFAAGLFLASQYGQEVINALVSLYLDVDALSVLIS